MSGGRTVLLIEFTMQSTKPTMSAPKKSTPVSGTAYEATAATSRTMSKIPVRVTTSSILMRDPLAPGAEL